VAEVEADPDALLVDARPVAAALVLSPSQTVLD